MADAALDALIRAARERPGDAATLVALADRLSEAGPLGRLAAVARRAYAVEGSPSRVAAVPNGDQRPEEEEYRNR